MPHGAGHAGGHHHHGGGGFHHHHHHHRGFHHHHYGATYGFGPHYRYGYNRRRYLGWGIVSLVIFGACIALSLIFSIRYGSSDDTSSLDYYSPNETRAISLSYVFCDSITVFTADLNTFSQHGELYLLSQEPSLTDHDSFEFQLQRYFFVGINYYHWNYHLYKDSTIEFSACKDNIQSGFKYYIIKGTDNFNRWENDPSSAYAVETGYIPAASTCYNSPRTNYTFNVQNEGEYYVAFLLELGTASGTLDIEFDVYRTKYAIEPDNVISNCSLGTEGCALDVPLSYSFALVALHWDPNSVFDWTGSVYVSPQCSTRVWMYVVISLASAGFCTIMITTIIVCCCCLARRNKKYNRLRGDNNPAPVVNGGPAPTTATYVTGTAPPKSSINPPSYEPPPKYSN